MYNSKKAVTNVGKTRAKKSSKTSIKTVTRKSKKSTILVKSETKNKFPTNDLQSKEVMSTSVDMPQESDGSCSEVIRESGETFDSQETISDNEMCTNVHDDQKPEIDAVEKRLDFSASFHGKLDSLNSVNLPESRESIVILSDLSNRLVILDSQSQMKRKANFSEDVTVSDKSGRTETHLKRSGKHAPRYKSVSETTIPEIILAKQDWNISGNPSSPILNIESKLTVDISNSFNNSNTNIMTDIRPSVDDLGAGTGNTNRNLRPRYHMDKLSEYISK